MPVTLSSCQSSALDVLSNTKDNVFLTGNAGTGKSFLLRHFLKTKDRKTFPVLASTGTAAILLGGRTLHSFFGLGIMEGGVSATVEKAVSNPRVVKRLRDIEGFVLDEVSMISGSTLRAAELVCRLARKIHAPWGGARVVACGDFSQLPPVSASDHGREWAFLDPTWQTTGFRNLELLTVLRTQDEAYTLMLNHVRAGEVTDHVRDYLNRKLDPSAGEDLHATSTFLVPRRDQADRFNHERLGQLRHPLHEVPTLYTGQAQALEAIKKQAPLPELLQIKKTALVMIRVNDPGYKYVNGSLATVSNIAEDELTLELVGSRREVTLKKQAFGFQNADGQTIASATNFPVTLAYATTIHKSQGATLDQMTCDLRRLWEPGHAYVALSRLRSGSGLTLVGWDEGSVARIDPDVRSFYESMSTKADAMNA